MRLRVAVSALALGAVLVLAVGSAQAAPGGLDSTFGTGGIVTTPIGTGTDYASSVALQPDGKIVAAGYAYTGSNNDFAVARYNADGSPDTSFDSDGKTTTPIGSSNAYGHAMAVQGDGKIVMAGEREVTSSDYDMGFARFNGDGSLDTTFGSSGKFTTSLGDDGALAVVLQPDGKIVAGGYVSTDSNVTFTFALARLTSNGALDTSFDSDGRVETAIGSTDDELEGLALQPDGKIVAVGTTDAGGGNHNWALARYNPDGSLDTGFGSGGKVTTDFGGTFETGRGVAIQPDGKIVAVGQVRVGGTTWEFGVARYNADGSLDTSFGTGGKVLTPIGSGNSLGQAVLLQPDGRIVAAGYIYNGTIDSFALARYNSDGSLDTSFGSGGTLTTTFGPGSSVGLAAALQPDGKIVVAGPSSNGSNNDFALVRFLGSTLTVTKGGGGSGTVGSSPGGIDCGSTCSSPFAAVPVTLTATAAAGSSFTGWSGDCSGTSTCNLTMSADHSATATFETDKTLTVAMVGSGTGTVTSSPSGISCGSTCTHAYAHGTSVTLTANASAGSTFTGWLGDCSGTGTCTLAMSADHGATATFESDKTLTVKKSGSGSGTVSSTPGGISCGSTCSHAYAHGTSVKLTASASSKSKFSGWSGDCSGTGSCTLTMSADHSATATFKVLCVVPKVKGKKLSSAKSAIKKAHCSVGKVTKAFSSKVKKDRVISQSPSSGKKLASGSKVKLKVSKGTKP